MPDRDTDLETLREQPENVNLAGGFGPLLVGIVLFVLMVLLAPTVAPEQVVERPVDGTTTTTTVVATTTTATSASTTTITIEAP